MPRRSLLTVRYRKQFQKSTRYVNSFQMSAFPTFYGGWLHIITLGGDMSALLMQKKVKFLDIQMGCNSFVRSFLLWSFQWYTFYLDPSWGFSGYFKKFLFICFRNKLLLFRLI